MNEQQERVNALIARIEEHQRTLDLKDKRFVARYYEYTGSAKTWRERLVARKWNELGTRITKWEKKLTALVAILDGGQAIGEYYEALPIAQHALYTYDVLQGQKNDRRVAFLIGPTGIGKSWAMKWLANQNRKDGAVYIYANECWDDSMPQIARAIAEVVGATIDKASGRNTFSNITRLLRAAPVTLMIDDIQKAGVLGLKLVKSLVDSTNCRFILGAYPQSWYNLINGSTDAYAEAQQILGRTVKPIVTCWLNGLRDKDAAPFLQAAGVKGDPATICGRILPHIRKGGNLRVLADAIGLARSNADDQDCDLDCLLVESAVYELCNVKPVGDK